MITNAKLDVFKKYKGDGDMYGRSGRSSEKQIVTDSDWSLIDVLLQDATVIVRGLGSEQRTAEAKRHLRETCEDETVVQRILEMVGKI